MPTFTETPMPANLAAITKYVETARVLLKKLQNQPSRRLSMLLDLQTKFFEDFAPQGAFFGAFEINNVDFFEELSARLKTRTLLTNNGKWALSKSQLNFNYFLANLPPPRAKQYPVLTQEPRPALPSFLKSVTNEADYSKTPFRWLVGTVEAAKQFPHLFHTSGTPKNVILDNKKLVFCRRRDKEGKLINFLELETFAGGNLNNLDAPDNKYTHVTLKQVEHTLIECPVSC